MAVTDYITIEGMILGEVTNGVMRNYGTDALGSVVATYTGGAQENTYRYKPFGALLAKTGSAADPSFLWVGCQGYRQTTLFAATEYVRRRHFASSVGQWASADPIWPSQKMYTYGGDNPVSWTDPTGLAPGSGGPLAVCRCCPTANQITATPCYGPGSAYTPACLNYDNSSIAPS